MYAINASNVNSAELSKEQTKLFEDFVKENQNKERVTLGNIQAKGYASPDGPEGLNEKLSAKRGESGQAAVGRALKGIAGLQYDVNSYGEDWDGFKAMVEASDMKDKNLILQVLNMYSSSAQRDAEIKNLSQVFEELKKDILPQLRRTQMLANIDIQGKTDAELLAALEEDINSLNLEEMLFVATLVEDNGQKADIYKAAADKFNDARAWNNFGVANAELGEWTAAEEAFAKATELSSAPALANNLALAALAQGKFDEAATYLPSANAETKAIAAVSEGKYTEAAAGLEGYNKAVAEVLDGNLAAAKNALTGLDCANADYLRGVIAAKEGNTEAALTNINKAIEKCESFKEKAANDINLASIADRL
jgi:tetratricopeptide (TPR) repeat protein